MEYYVFPLQLSSTICIRINTRPPIAISDRKIQYTLNEKKLLIYALDIITSAKTYFIEQKLFWLKFVKIIIIFFPLENIFPAWHVTVIITVLLILLLFNPIFRRKKYYKWLFTSKITLDIEKYVMKRRKQLIYVIVNPPFSLFIITFQFDIVFDNDNKYAKFL